MTARSHRHVGPALVAFVVFVVLLTLARSVDVPRTGYGVKSDEATYVAMALSMAYDGDLAFGLQQAVSRQDALRMMTSAAARLSFDETNRGSIETGQFGDFVVLDEDILTCAAERLRSIRPQMTVVGGRIGFERTAGR